jgi:hypothetical protein
VSCVPTDEGRMIKATGWYNIQLQIIPPPRVVVEKVKYVFHPAFNISKLTLIQEPFDLLVKLCSSNVHVLIEITFHKKDNWPKSIFKKKESNAGSNKGNDKMLQTQTQTQTEVFTIAHKLEKEVTARKYIYREFNGLT